MRNAGPGGEESRHLNFRLTRLSRRLSLLNAFNPFKKVHGLFALFESRDGLVETCRVNTLAI